MAPLRIHTRAGLPNSCSDCGAPVDPSEGWFAEHDDAARAGDALCGTCHARAEGNPVEKVVATVQAVGEAVGTKPGRAQKPKKQRGNEQGGAS